VLCLFMGISSITDWPHWFSTSSTRLISFFIIYASMPVLLIMFMLTFSSSISAILKNKWSCGEMQVAFCGLFPWNSAFLRYFRHENQAFWVKIHFMSFIVGFGLFSFFLVIMPVWSRFRDSAGWCQN
jgi:hypothetical protein